MAKHDPSPAQEATWTTVRSGIVPTVREAGFLLLLALSIAWSWEPLTTVIGRSLKYGQYQHYSHIILLPFFSAYLLYLKRDAILARASRGVWPGSVLMAVGAAMTWLGRTTIVAAEPEHQLSLAMLGLVTLAVGAFVLCYGPRAFRLAAFPFLLLLFMVPFPPAVLSAIIRFLQKGSTEATHLLFGLIGMPFYREGFVFALPGLVIEVAEECSGIRSSLALLISGLVMAQLVLRSTWTRLAVVVAVVPLAIVKNGLRIVLLSWLGVHVDQGFITGSALHSRGGIPFFLASLLVLAGLAWVLRRWELRSGHFREAGARAG